MRSGGSSFHRWAAVRGRFHRSSVIGCVGAMLLVALLPLPLRGAQPVQVLVLSPLEEEDLGPDALIAISVIDPDRQVDLERVRLLVDGRDVTSAASVRQGAITYLPSSHMTPGEHRFELRLWDVGGKELPGLRQEFRVAGEIPLEEFWTVGGRVTLEYLVDDLSGPGRVRRQEPPSTRTAALNVQGHAGDVRYRGKFFLTSDETDGYQPRNRYSLHLDGGWAGADLGDVNYRFSRLVMRGKRTRGVGGYLQWGGTKISVLRGGIKRGIEGTYQIEPAYFDSSLADTVPADTSVVGATYARNLFGARVLQGGGRNFQLGFDVVRVRDDVESITLGLLPKDNIVLGGNLLLAPGKRRLIFESNWAWSMITEDISGGAISKDEVDSLLGTDLPFEPLDYEDYFIINTTTSPLDPRDLSNLAWDTSLRGNVRGQIFEARYQHVGTAFRSLAAPSIQPDRSGLRLTDTFRLLRNRLQVAAEYERFHDNLSDDKTFTTTTNILGATARVMPRRVDLTHVSLGLQRYGRDNDAPAGADSVRVDENTTTFIIGTGYHFWFRQGHDLSLSYMRSQRDAVQAQAEATQSDWSFGWTTRFENLPLMLELGYGINTTEYPAPTAQVSEVKYQSRALRFTYGLLEGRLEAHGTLRQVLGESDGGVYDADKTSFEAGARYRLREGAVLSGRFDLVGFSDEVDPDNDYDETVFNLRLVQEF